MSYFAIKTVTASTHDMALPILRLLQRLLVSLPQAPISPAIQLHKNNKRETTTDITLLFYTPNNVEIFITTMKNY